MKLDDALARISEIHAHVLKNEVFRGYHAWPMAATGGLALAAAWVQATVLVPATVVEFTVFWLAVATVAVTLCALDLVRGFSARERASDRRRSLVALGQVLPAFVAGGILTAVLLVPPAPHATLLPGLWSICGGLALFASRLQLPRAVGFVAAWYVLAGGGLLVGAPAVPSPWGMGVTYGAGQLLLAFVLWRALERRDDGLA